MITALFFLLTMNYDREIYKVLVEAGDAGISLQKLSRHVHNACNSLFNPIELSDVHSYVTSFVQRNSGSPTSPLERTSLRGVYRLNPHVNMTNELRLQFSIHDAHSEDAQKKSEDFSLMLPFD